MIEFPGHCASISTFSSHATLTSGIHLPSSRASETESEGAGSSYTPPVLSTKSSGPIQPSSSSEAITTLTTTSEITEAVTVPTLSSKASSGLPLSGHGYSGSTVSTWSPGIESSSPEEPTGPDGLPYEPSTTVPHSTVPEITSAGPIQPSSTESHVVGSETPTYASFSSKSHAGPGLSTGLTRSHHSTRLVSSKNTHTYAPTSPTGATSDSPHQPSSTGGILSSKSTSRVASNPHYASTSVSDSCGEEGTSTQWTSVIGSTRPTEHTSIRGRSTLRTVTGASPVPTSKSSAGPEESTSYGHTNTETCVSTGVESAGPTAPESLGYVTLPSTWGSTLVPTGGESTLTPVPTSETGVSSGPTPSAGTSRKFTRSRRWSTERHPTIPPPHFTQRPSKTTIQGPLPTREYGTDIRHPVPWTEDSHPITQSSVASSYHPTYRPSSHSPNPSSPKVYEPASTIDSGSLEEPIIPPSYTPTNVASASAPTVPTEPAESYPPVSETSTEDLGPIEGTKTAQPTTFATTTTRAYNPGYDYEHRGNWDGNKGGKGHW